MNVETLERIRQQSDTDPTGAEERLRSLEAERDHAVFAEGMRLRGLIRADLGRYDQAIDDLHASVARAPDAQRSRCVSSLGEVLSARGRIAEALVVFYEEEERLGESPLPWHLLMNLGNAELAAGHMEEGLRRLELAQDHARLEAPERAPLVMGNLGVAHGRAGQLLQARHWFEEAAVAHEDLGPSAGAANNLANLGKVLCMQGANSRGFRLLAEGAAMQQDLGLVRDSIRTELLLAEAQIAAEEKLAAEGTLHRAWTAAVALDDPGLAADAAFTLSELHSGLGKLDAAHRSLRQAWDLREDAHRRARTQELEVITARHDLVVQRTRSNALERQARELAEARDAAQAATDAKSAFLGMISHELRTPLQGVIGALELQALDGGQDWSRTARAAATSALGLIERLLRYTRQEANTTAPFAFDPMAPLEEAGDVVSPLARAGGLTLDLVAEDDAPELVLGSRDLLHYVVVNLVGNAIKYTEDGGITVTLRAGEVLMVDIDDTGPGIPHSSRGQVMEAFVQLDGPRRQGVGLGLAITHRIVSDEGGELQILDAPGGGARLRVTLPWPVLPLPGARRVSLSPEDVPSGQLSGRVLLVEDNPTVQMVVAALLDSLGLQVSIAPDGETGVAMAVEPFDLILMDQRLPGCDGIEATRRIRASGNRCPILGLSADVDESLAQRCLEVGMSGVLSKPIDRGTLAAAAAAWIGQRGPA